MIRNVVIHLTSEQPLLADLYSLPTAADAGLVCTNLRMLDGKRPVFIDHIGSTFFFPYHVVRFLEITEAAMIRQHVPGNGSASATAGTGDDATTAGVAPDSLLPIVLGAPADDGSDEEAEAELEIDEGFLQRIRDI